MDETSASPPNGADGDPPDTDLFGQMHAIAQRLFASQPANHTLQPTALVDDVWIRLADREEYRDNKNAFLAAAAAAMRQLLSRHARDRARLKRGGGWQRLELIDGAAPNGRREVDTAELDEALVALEAANPRYARLFEMRILAGMTNGEAAETLGVSRRAVELDWRFVSAWVRRHLSDGRRDVD